MSVWDDRVTSCLLYNTFNITLKDRRGRIFTMDKLYFGLLLTIALHLCHGQSHCRTSYMCCFRNIGGKSAISSLISRRYIYPATCQRACQRRPECIASTYDPTAETCELHADAEDGACMSLSSAAGFFFCMVKNDGGPCQQVWDQDPFY